MLTLFGGLQSLFLVSQVRQRNLYFLDRVQVSFLYAFRSSLTPADFRSDDYASNDCTSKLKGVLLNKVVVGKGCKMMHDNTTLTAPPAGYDLSDVHPRILTELHFIRYSLRKAAPCIMTSWWLIRTKRSGHRFWSPMIVIMSDAFLVYVALGWMLRYNSAVQPTIYVQEYIMTVRYS